MVDNLTTDQRRRCMQAVRTRDTDLERRMAAALRAKGLRWGGHTAKLPGRPDFVFSAARVAVFIDGDFWHGYRFPAWREKIPAFWQLKIEGNRRRDTTVRRKLRRAGWTVIRVWGHQILRDVSKPAARIHGRVRAAMEFLQ